MFVEYLMRHSCSEYNAHLVNCSSLIIADMQTACQDMGVKRAHTVSRSKGATQMKIIHHVLSGNSFADFLRPFARVHMCADPS
jgi:hypothetical protein